MSFFYFRYHLSQFSNAPWVYDRNEVCFYVKLILESLKSFYKRGRGHLNVFDFIIILKSFCCRKHTDRCDVAVVLDHAELSADPRGEISVDEAEHNLGETKTRTAIFETC